GPGEGPDATAPGPLAWPVHPWRSLGKIARSLGRMRPSAGGAGAHGGVNDHRAVSENAVIEALRGGKARQVRARGRGPVQEDVADVLAEKDVRGLAAGGVQEHLA